MKKNQYQSIMDLQGSLRRLFFSINFYPEEIRISRSNGILPFLQNLLNRGVSVKYLDTLKEQTDQAADLLEASREKQQNEKKQLEEQAKRIKELEEHPTGSSEDELLGLIKNIISFRDNQFIKRGFLHEQGESKDNTSIRIVESILRETAGLLTKSGVEIMEDKGTFFSEYQTIIDTVETKDEKLDGTIAEVIRPGYCYKGEPLRAQEVIIYKKKN